MNQHPQPVVYGETGRVRGIYDAMVPRYDRMIAIAEKLLFSARPTMGLRPGERAGPGDRCWNRP